MGILKKQYGKIQEKGQGTILLTVERNGKEVKIEIYPDTQYTYYIGVTLQQAEDTLINHLIYGGIETKTFAFSILDNVKKLTK